MRERWGWHWLLAGVLVGGTLAWSVQLFALRVAALVHVGWQLLVLTAVAYLLRTWQIQRVPALRSRWITVRLIAPLLPGEEVRKWVLDMESQLTEAGPARSRANVGSIWLHLPSLITSTWGAWFSAHLDGVRRRLGNAAIKWANPQLGAVNAVLRSTTPMWPSHDLQWEQFQAQWRALRRWALVLSHVVSHRQHPALTSRAAWLATLCSRLLAEQRRLKPTPPDRLPTRIEAALLLEINHTTLMLTAMIEELTKSESGS